MHLSGIKTFDPASLDGLLERLAAFKPEIVTIEDEPGEECDLATRHPAKYGADYCVLPEAARKATGLAIPEALAEADKLAARLAARLHLPRVHPVDNHTGDRVDVPDIKPWFDSWLRQLQGVDIVDAGQVLK